MFKFLSQRILEFLETVVIGVLRTAWQGAKRSLGIPLSSFSATLARSFTIKLLNNKEGDRNFW
jgi:hypothetical protein